MTTPTDSQDRSGVSATRITDVESRAEAACRDLAATAEERSNPPQTAPSTVLGALAANGLLQIDSHRPDATSITGTDLRRMALVAETLASHSGTVASIYMVNMLVGALLTLAGSRQQKSQLLPALGRGKVELAFAMTEPQAGSDAAAMNTIAHEHPDGYCLAGEKTYITGAATADWIVVVARVGQHQQEKRKLSLFLVPGNTPGLHIEPLEKMSGNEHPSCRVHLDRVLVPSAQAVGGIERLGTAWETLRTIGSIERMMVASMAVGTARAATRRATEIARSREQFGRKIASFQSIEHALVDMHVTLSAMSLMVENALATMERGEEEPTLAISMAKCYCAEQLQLILARGMRIVGGRGYFNSEPMAGLYREAPFSLYAGGTVEIQKMLISRALGLSA